MELNDLLDFQNSISKIAEVGEKLLQGPPPGLSEEQSKEYYRILNNTKMGKQLKEGLSNLAKRKADLDKITREAQSFYTK